MLIREKPIQIAAIPIVLHVNDVQHSMLANKKFSELLGYYGDSTFLATSRLWLQSFA